MPSLLRRNLVCFYCGKKSRNTHNGKPLSWHCHNCDAVNHLDERGQITDPPTESQATPASSHVQYARPIARSASPEFSRPEDIFCFTCQKNQHILTQALAEFLPSEDDPDYAKAEAGLDDYRRRMEEQYPQVCENCAPRVRDRIRASGYAAKTDHLRRMMQKTKTGAVRSPGVWGWKNWLVFFGGSTYLASVLLALLWHAAGVLMRAEDCLTELDNPGYKTCGLQAYSRKEVEPACFYFLYPLAKVALGCGMLSFWWNAKLQEKVTVPGGRLRGLQSHIGLQGVVLAIRAAALWFLRDVGHIENALQAFRAGHLFMLVFTFIASILSLGLVKIDRKPAFSFNQIMEPVISTPPRRTGSLTSYQPGLEGFGSSFPISKLAEPSGAQLPPSPTESDRSMDYSTTETTIHTPASRTHRSSVATLDSEMDWTPTRMDWTPTQPTPSNQPQQSPITAFYPFGKAPAAPSPETQNPFRGTLPAAPKPPAHKLRNPFPQPLFQQPPITERKDFFSSMMISQGSFGTDPKQARRKEYEFQEAKLKLREDQPATGLESMYSMFNIRDNSESAIPQSKQQSSVSSREQYQPAREQIATGTEETGLQAAGQILLIACVPILAGIAAAWLGGYSLNMSPAQSQ